MSERVTGLGPGSEVTDAAERTVLPVAFEDLVAWYPFRSGTGEDITAGDRRFGDTTDYSATVNGATFQASGGVTDIQTGANSGAFDFDGTDDDLDNVRGLGGASITVLAQINISSANSVFGKVYSSNPASGSGGFRVSARDDDSKVRALVLTSSGVDLVDTSTTGLRGQFGQVGLRYDGQTLDVIKNGVVANSTSATRVAPQNQAKIGHRPGGDSTERFGGIIDSVRVYNTPLPDSKINQIFQNTKP